ncbi:hypothetical protein GQ43DRAFT_143125 [Delitschia confertaspora ATCC 74209]|uniref:DUF1996 domain-containing protein n=1 Tax=Delitschia confertaspora ATCC 74209 TaxID=1513339 RepID=A0A9P4JIP8_9PLEO|nr:hypothetical protein GQ43DRAFT_143125 [Delitschia confertaspora ATCC 74209]
MKSVATFAAVLAAITGTIEAFWRMECHSRTGLARIDPIVEPGIVSSHAHTVHGGSNFGMDVTYDDLMDSDCTSCRVTQDKSAYWTPSLHFVHANGTVEVVPQVGGMLAYYLLYGENITAFPKGFRMLAGDARLRNFTAGPIFDPPKSNWAKELKTQPSLAQRALGFNCLNYAKDPEASMYRHFMPDKDYLDEHCTNGIRAEIFFPSCWNGNDTDSNNHRDHMAYPDTVNDGVCPEGFKTRVPSLFYETIWDTYAFHSMPGQFVFANGDPTGYGYHADFMTGWDVDFLQSAVHTCTNPSGNITDCPLFNIQSEDEGAKCNFKTPSILKADNCDGPADGLCGNVAVQNGPDYASVNPKPTGSKGVPQYTPPASLAFQVPTLSYKAPTTAVTDKYGGGISIARVPGAPAETNQPMEMDLTLSETLQGKQQATPTPEPAAVSSSTISTITSAVAIPVESAPAAGDHIISTSTYTSAGTVYEVAIAQVQVTVTVQEDAEATPPTARHRRHAHAHAHMHHRRDKEHGLLGRRR